MGQMIEIYRKYLYKVFTVPNTEGLKSQVFSTFIAMTLLQGANITTATFLIRNFVPIDLREVSRVIIAIVIFVLPMILNYNIIYHNNGYKKILKQYSSEKRGTLLHILIYGFITIILFLGAGFQII